MGYRPTIKCNKLSCELGKFYGYVELDNLDSIDWLIQHNKIEDEDKDIFNYSYDGPSIEFTADEFRSFIDLYLNDINKYKYDKDTIAPNCISNFTVFNEMYKNESDKIIEWG